LYDSLGVIYTP